MKLDLTIDQINIVLNTLANAPYAQVAALIADIQRQGQDQMAAQSNVEESKGDD